MSKYRNEKTKIDGILFSSKKEAARYYELKQLASTGVITGLELQPRFVLQESFTHNGKKYRKIEYVADFVYSDGDTVIVEDTKGFRTEVYKIKKKLLLFKYPLIDFREI